MMMRHSFPARQRPAAAQPLTFSSRAALRPVAALSIPSTVKATQPRTNLLEQAIPSLVHQLSKGQAASPQSCLQLVRATPGHGMGFEYKPLTGNDMNSEVWQQVMPAASLDNTLAVILARPIPDPLHYCPFSTPATTPTSSSCDSAACAEGSCLSSVPDMQGSVDDDCCGGVGSSPHVHAAHHHTTPASSIDSTSSSTADSSSSEPPSSRSRRRFLRRQQARGSPLPAQPQPPAPPPAQSPPASYYGLAVQTVQPTATGAGSREHLDIDSPKYLDGCYVLKLCRSSGITGCTCTAYTLTHVCRGQPLYEQMQGSWLVN